MKHKIQLILILGFILVGGYFLFSNLNQNVPVAKAATTYAVKKDGTGNFTRIQDCANTAVAGDVCSIYPGLYDEIVNISHSGTSANPIVFKAATTTKPQVAGFLPYNASYITIDGLEVTAVGMANPWDFNLYHGSILVIGGTGNKVTNNYIHDTYGVCIGFSLTSFLAVSGNKLDHCGATKSIIGNPGGPYNISAGVNDQIKFSVNTTAVYTITLTPGTGRTTGQICADISAVAGLSSIPILSRADCDGVAADGRVNIFPSAFGPSASIILMDTPNNAYATLGLSLGGEIVISHLGGLGVSTDGPANDVLIENNQISRVGDFFLPGGSRYVFRNNVLGPSDIANSDHIDGIQSNAETNFLLIEGNKFTDNHTSDNHFFLTSMPSTNWIVRGNYSVRSKGGQGWGNPGFATSKFATYNNTWYNNVDFYNTYNQIVIYNSPSNMARNNIWYRSVVDYGGNPYYTDNLSPLDKDYDLLYSSGNPQEVHQFLADPLFTNAAADNFSLQSSSPARDAGGPLGRAANSGSASVSLSVSNSYAFQPGWAGTQADWVAVGSATNVSKISAIDYSTNIITLASPITWNSGDPVYLYKKSDGVQVLYGTAPDIGAFEFSSTITTLQGDLNNDGIVNSLDWSIMNSKWFTSDATADLNHDGVVNSLDWSIMNSNWFKTI